MGIHRDGAEVAHLAPSHVAAHANTVKFWSSSTQKEKALTRTYRKGLI